MLVHSGVLERELVQGQGQAEVVDMFHQKMF
jgi:hypothetical protein